MSYRTKTYIAADWEHDIEVVKQLRKWNDSDHWSLSFTDAHEFIQTRDSSLNCTIKASLSKRLDMSKTFVLIVSDYTKSARAGGCQYCSSYNYGSCLRNRSIDNRSYLQYECAKALDAGIKIIVLYNGTRVNRNLCPDSLKDVGTHIPFYNCYGVTNYSKIKVAMK